MLSLLWMILYVFTLIFWGMGLGAAEGLEELDLEEGWILFCCELISVIDLIVHVMKFCYQLTLTSSFLMIVSWRVSSPYVWFNCCIDSFVNAGATLDFFFIIYAHNLQSITIKSMITRMRTINWMIVKKIMKISPK